MILPEGLIGSAGFTASSASLAEAGALAAAVFTAAIAPGPAAIRLLRSFGSDASAAERSITDLALDQPQRRALALLEHHQLHGSRLLVSCSVYACRAARLVGADLRDRAFAVLQPPAVLHGPIVHGVEGLSPQRDLRHLRPARIDQRLARDGDQVGLALLQDGLGEVRIDDEPDRHRHDAGLPAHALGVGHLEAPAALDARRRRRAVQAAGGAVDHVDAARLELLRVGHRVVHGPAAIEAVDGGDAQEQRLVLRPCGAHRLRHLERKARAAGEVAAVGVVALVRQGRQELVHQVAVRVVDLEDLEAGFQRALGRVHPVALERRRDRRRRAAAARYGPAPSAPPSVRRCPRSSRRARGPLTSARRCRTRAAAWSPCGPRARSGCRAPPCAPS